MFLGWVVVGRDGAIADDNFEFSTDPPFTSPLIKGGFLDAYILVSRSYGLCGYGILSLP